MASGQSLTSVVMVSYRTGPILFEAVAAVLAQDTPVELILVDNGNPPEIVEKLQSLSAGNSRIRLLGGHGNIGFSRGCNLGAKAAGGEFLLFLNPDSILPPGAPEKLKQHGARLTRPWMLGARLLDGDGKDQRGCRRALLTPTTAFIEALHLGALFPQLRLNRHEGPVPDSLTQMPAISGAFMFLPREDFWNIGGFDEGYFLHVEDLDICLRFRRAGGQIWFAPDVVVKHIGATSNATRAFIERHKTRGFVRYFHKNFGDRYPKPFLWLLDAAIWARAGIRIGLTATAHRQNKVL